MTINSELLQAIEKQLNRERDAAAVYESLAIWCEANDYSGFAGFFQKQAAEEREHAQKFIQHLLDRGAQPKLGSVGAPPAEFASLVEVAQTALAHEEANTKGILETLDVAHKVKDPAAIGVLNWFVGEQVEEEVWANKMVTLTSRMGNAGQLYSLDRNIVADLTGKNS